MKYQKIREEELKNKVGADWFSQFDTTEIIGNIDFSVFPRQDNLFGRTALLWAEAKTGNYDVPAMFVQLILTIGKARTFDKTLPPAFLGAFDFKKMAFIPYISIQDIFYLNDFNWNVTPSNHSTKEFKLIKERIEAILKQKSYIFDFQKDEKELATFIKNNVAKATTANKIKIDKNNFIPIYLRWLEIVKPNIDVNWDDLKKANIYDNDFYLADLFVDDRDTQNIDDDLTIRDSLFVVFQNQGYKIAKEDLKQMFDATIKFKNTETYLQFWKLYKRPPIKEFQDYIIERRDLLAPQDIRERKGAFFTPRKWVELSQKYIADYLGEDWQDEYYIWDCAAGTGNLLAGLTNKYNIYASTLDQADVNVMHERIEHGANLLDSHVFQFDFLNDDFTKLPQSLQDIINNEEKRKKLVIYINPPYAETGSTKHKESKKGVSNETMSHKKYFAKMSTFSKRELYVQFLMRIYADIPTSKIVNFSKLKNLQSSYFLEFREVFQAKLEKLFLVPADTFDNVKGKFPIGFFIWNSEKNQIFQEIIADVFDSESKFIGNKKIFSYNNEKYLNDWLRPNWSNIKKEIGFLSCNSNDFQNQNGVFIEVEKKNQTSTYFKPIGVSNLKESSIYFAVRHCISADWLNDRDQFLFPNNRWMTDLEFQNNCLVFTLFRNDISAKSGINHWIPFTEHEVNAKEKFASNFMTNFINGKLKIEEPSENTLFENENSGGIYDNQPRQFSAEATAVFDAGRELWKYYHAQKFPSSGGVSEGRGGYNVNASLYDIREYFQGRNEKGRMNSRSEDETYTQLLGDLRSNLKILADVIKPKIYEYGFLKE
ncbi:hypothetical protein SAMN05421789_10795 [Kaistella chaponensis]|uniref:Uncharacterized protein n=1 Tax=Kaistella chaponensis TaxID=713588 RepID=A0A1N7M4J2_9FLAO|nr:hypothetical protein [Kaistella chaponensis]SIS81036.1 hypothetical protein SAMN05421789_10795 [Kaistella chaponensis]